MVVAAVMMATGALGRKQQRGGRAARAGHDLGLALGLSLALSLGLGLGLGLSLGPEPEPEPELGPVLESARKIVAGWLARCWTRACGSLRYRVIAQMLISSRW
jgi:hypothetical protein